MHLGSKRLALVAQNRDIGTNLVVANYDTHAATYMSLGFAKDAQVGVLGGTHFLNTLILGMMCLNFGKNDSRSTNAFLLDFGNRQTEDGTAMQLKFAEVLGTSQRNHTCVVWTW